MSELPRPTTTHPAKWLQVRDLVIGDVVITNTLGGRGLVTAITPLVGPGKRSRVSVGNRTYYPRATGDTPVLVLR